MFKKAFTFRAGIFFAVATVAFFLMTVVSAFPALQKSHVSHDLPGCALMSHGTEGHMAGEGGNVSCPMSLVAHFAKLGSMFTITLTMIGGAALLIALAFFSALASAFLIVRLFGSPRVHSPVFAFSRTPPRNLRLQQAFSQGILHSKAF